MPLVWCDPFAGGDALFLLGYNGLLFGGHGEPGGLLQVPAAVEIEDVVGFDRNSSRGRGPYSCLFLYFSEGGLEEGLAGLDLAFGEVPTAVALDEEHGAIRGSDDAAGGTDITHAALEDSQHPQGDVEGVIFIT